MLYDAGEGGHAYETVKMELGENGTWTTSVDKDLLGKYYAFNVKSTINGRVTRRGLMLTL